MKKFTEIRESKFPFKTWDMSSFVPDTHKKMSHKGVTYYCQRQPRGWECSIGLINKNGREFIKGIGNQRDAKKWIDNPSLTDTDNSLK